MTQQPSAALDTIQIRYRISYLTWLRLKAYAQYAQLGMSYACDAMLGQGLDDVGIATDPAVLLGLEEKDDG